MPCLHSIVGIRKGIPWWAVVAFVAVAGTLVPATSQAPQSEEVARAPTYTEGIVFDHGGNAYISHDKFITRVAPSGATAIWAETGSPNGHKVLGDGTHLVCDRLGFVYHLDREGKILRKASAQCEGKPLRTPNDICLDTPNQGFYFTDPGGSREKPVGTVHYVDSAGKTHLAAKDLFYPNGIVLRADGKTLLVGESMRNQIVEFGVSTPGKLGPPKVFAKLPGRQPGQLDNKPDGMTLDEEGNLYVAHYGMGQIQVLNSSGKLIRRLSAGPVIFTSNVAFAGPNRSHLYFTGSIGPSEQTTGVLHRMRLDEVRGLDILPALSKYSITLK
jgi:gluconolactonase